MISIMKWKRSLPVPSIGWNQWNNRHDWLNDGLDHGLINNLRIGHCDDCWLRYSNTNTNTISIFMWLGLWFRCRWDNYNHRNDDNDYGLCGTHCFLCMNVSLWSNYVSGIYQKKKTIKEFSSSQIGFTQKYTSVFGKSNKTKPFKVKCNPWITTNEKVIEHWSLITSEHRTFFNWLSCLFFIQCPKSATFPDIYMLRRAESFIHSFKWALIPAHIVNTSNWRLFKSLRSTLGFDAYLVNVMLELMFSCVHTYAHMNVGTQHYSTKPTSYLLVSVLICLHIFVTKRWCINDVIVCSYNVYIESNNNNNDKHML